ncbi:autotransporter outer membrane beta-barrel domain-containing protein [Snodgrassella alvi]|uniref:autotransporter outer membrane beta-barrel domain-containing protein n=1 Tax=Snodgrassella alvi TaxID=1196083 RepID=UPI00351BF3C1
MNNIYKSKWSEATQTWVACSELVRGKTKNNCVKIAAAVALALTSLGSYADDTVPSCDNNAGSVVVSGTTCSLPSLPDGKPYTEISGSANADLTGGDINVIGSTKVKKVINVDGESTLKATNITTTNKVNSKGTNALAIAGGSTVDIDENLTATNMGNKADTIVNSGGSTLTVGKDLTINDDKGFSNGIQNIENSTIRADNITITSEKVGFSNDGILNKDNSVIDVEKNIDITSEGSDGNASIENTDGGKIHAGNITIDQGGKNYAIHQTSETSSIIVDKDLNITSGNIPEGNSTVTIEGGDITVGGKTDITTHVDSETIEEPENVSAISITNGTYTAGNGANIKIKSKNEDDEDEDFKGAAGVIIGDNGRFINDGLPDNGDPDNGVLKVNNGNNTVIATDSALKGEAFFENGKNGKTTSNVDTVVHNSDGTLHVTNDGKLISESDKDSVLKNNKNGIIDVTNRGSIAGNITNAKDGNIYINNSGNIQKKIETSDNTQSKTEISDNTPPNKIENSGTGSINITNTGTIDNDILNTNTGTIRIINNDNGTLNGSITNTGDQIKVNDPNADTPANILIDNNKDLNGTVDNNGSGKIVVNNNEASSVINGNIINTKDGNITVNNKNSASTITGNITNQDNGTVTINNSGKIQNDNTRNKIENSGTGSMDITNTGTIASDILNGNTGDITINNNKTSSVVNGETDYTNPTTINGDIINNKDGNITVNNNESTSFIKGGITNSQKGSITINNSGSISGSDDTKKITNSNAGEIIINNKPEGSFLSDIENDATSTGKITIENEGHVVSNISNKNTGFIKISNKDSFGGSIKNTGDILIDNYHAFGSTIDNDGNGTIVINNHENSSPTATDGSSIYGVINNKQSGNITVNNDGNESVIDSDINNEAKGNITVNNNTDSAIISGNITNSQAGSITINNSGLTVLYRKVTNSGAGNIDITNNDKGNFKSAIDNDATSTGIITLKNKDGGTVNSAITNQNTGAIEIINNGTISGSTTNDELTNSIKNTGTGSISLINNGKIVSDILNGAAGTINITNDGTLSGSIKNTGDKSTIADNNIDITNNTTHNITSDILNEGTGTIKITNNGTISGSTTNDELTNSIKNTGTGSISLTNNSKIVSDILNGAAGAINITNDGTLSGSIKNTGDKSTVSDYNIDITNNNELTGSIENNGTGSISLTNNSKIASDILNGAAGAIKITNNGTLNGSMTNTGDKGTADNIWIDNNHILNSTINNEGNGSIVINNNTASSVINGKSIHTKAADTDTKFGINGDITNKNTGKITLKNSGNIQNKIENSGSGLIDITNDNTGNIASTILNGGAGIIDITNDGTLSGSITNTGDPSTVAANNIDIKNSTTGNIASKILNGGAGNIKITNNGTISGSTTDDELPNSIENTGTGNISLINDGKIASDILNGAAGSGIKITNNNTLSGTITNTNSGSVYATNTGTFTGMTTNSGSGILDLDNKGIWNNTGNSVLTRLQNTTGTIIFPQVSEVNAGDKDQYHTITVNGNYTGGGLMRVNTVWNKDGTSYSDRVDIHGDVDGAATTVRTLNEKGIYGDVTLKEIPIHSAVVVHVAGKSSGNDFTGSAPTTNAGEAQLKKIDTTSGTDYAWTLTAQPKTPDPVVPVPPGPTVSDKPVLPAPPIKEIPIYAEPVSGYVQMPTADMELGFTTVGTLHERRGENQTYNITGSNNTALGDDQQQTWGRVLVKHLDKDGKKRLDTAGNQSVLQIGHDFILDENEKTGIRRHIGGYVAYGHNENDFRDEYRAKNGYIVDDHYTGKGRTDAVSVGGYGTFYGNNGGYVDLVGQVTYLRNKYNARSNESVHQNGWGAALSAETGKSFIVYGNNWFVEPQAQLVYQYLSLDDFNDRIRHVDQHDPSALRGRVGMRFGYNGDTRDNLPSSSFYGIANIWHDFVNPKSVDIGRDNLKEEYAKTWGELGLGIQLPITRQSDFYSDIRYEKNFGSDKRKGFKGTMGYKYTWL